MAPEQIREDPKALFISESTSVEVRRWSLGPVLMASFEPGLEKRLGLC